MPFLQGGQWMLNLVDFFGASTIIFILGLFEIIAICWVYGVNRLCRDIDFMISHKPGLYWRLCWGILTPLMMIVILIYTVVSFTPATYKGLAYPEWATSKFITVKSPKSNLNSAKISLT